MNAKEKTKLVHALNPDVCKKDQIDKLSHKLYIVWSGDCGSRKTLPSRFCGYHIDDHKIVWDCFTPTVNDLSAWVRLESAGKRTRFVYDPGHGFRKTLLQMGNP